MGSSQSGLGESPALEPSHGPSSASQPPVSLPGSNRALVGSLSLACALSQSALRNLSPTLPPPQMHELCASASNDNNNDTKWKEEGDRRRTPEWEWVRRKASGADGGTTCERAWLRSFPPS
uniref:Uncharacterized protein n=1 Tax=Pipistrellus kuhlii TaxID=59472 RepID=A0A7J7WD14_PIPKU|nr:hypothetical protein mPipKuh1_008000 [Pipistrellus kuhlii]